MLLHGWGRALATARDVTRRAERGSSWRSLAVAMLAHPPSLQQWDAHPSWEEVLTIARQLWQDTTSDQIQKQTQTLVLQLTEGGWIRLRKPLTTGAAYNEV
jgi:hypothetical protein